MNTTPPASTRVYIVEDSAPIRQQLRALLREIDGVAIIGDADSPKPAIEAILEARPEVVVLDLHLVRGSGLEVLREVCPKVPEVTFIVLTNHPESQYRSACLKAGARYFFDKSAEFGKVKKVIADLGAPRHQGPIHSSN
jgi:DNA-binding NarL/FixJ family response regulator